MLDYEYDYRFGFGSSTSIYGIPIFAGLLAGHKGGAAINSNPLMDLVNLSPAEQARRGLAYTPGEILQQPELWTDTAARTAACLAEIEKELTSFLADPAARIVLTGAGSSHFIGDSLAPSLGRAFGRVVMSVESTDIVTDPEILAAPGPLLMVSFARSGDSPESMGAYRLAAKAAPRLRQLIITCNEQGELARAARANGDLCLALDPRTNDRGLAMTSSVTDLFLAGLGLAYAGRWGEYQRLAGDLSKAGERLLTDMPHLIGEIVAAGFSRLVYLGSGPLYGAAREMALKILEMTGGAIPSMARSYLGFRHGPMSFLNSGTFIVAMRSMDSYVRKYEDDLLAQLAAKGFADRMLALEPQKAEGMRWRTLDLTGEGVTLPEAWLPALAVPVGQVLALLASLKLGRRPDQPSEDGLITRVVEGVVLYDREWSGGLPSGISLFTEPG